MTLLSALRATGLTVNAVPGWATNGDHWPVGAPFGIMQHHTTAPIPYPISWLDGSSSGLVKCNLNIKQDGAVWLVNGRTCNFASGPGSAVVLSETKKNIAPPANARDRRLADTTTGNRYYFNIENDHAGLGGPISNTQYQAILTATGALMGFYDLKPNQVISHAEWTARKVDPYWNRSTRTVEQIRVDLSAMSQHGPEQWDDADWSAFRKRTAGNTWGSDGYTIPDPVTGAPMHPNTMLRAIRTDMHQTEQLVRALKLGSDAELAAIAKAVQDEEDRRARERLNA